MACLVRSGKVNIVRTASTGRDFDVKAVEAGTIFGDMPMLGQSMLGAQAVAADASKVTFISPRTLRRSLPRRRPWLSIWRARSDRGL